MPRATSCWEGARRFLWFKQNERVREGERERERERARERERERDGEKIIHLNVNG